LTVFVTGSTTTPVFASAATPKIGSAPAASKMIWATVSSSPAFG
jgi:hypothetical protein